MRVSSRGSRLHGHRLLLLDLLLDLLLHLLHHLLRLNLLLLELLLHLLQHHLLLPDLLLHLKLHLLHRLLVGERLLRQRLHRRLHLRLHRRLHRRGLEPGSYADADARRRQPATRAPRMGRNPRHPWVLARRSWQPDASGATQARFRRPVADGSLRRFLARPPGDAGRVADAAHAAAGTRGVAAAVLQRQVRGGARSAPRATRRHPHRRPHAASGEKTAHSTRRSTPAAACLAVALDDAAPYAVFSSARGVRGGGRRRARRATPRRRLQVRAAAGRPVRPHEHVGRR